MSAAFREALPAGKRPLLVVGGPRFDELMAGELGVDRIFGRGTTPREVASYLVHALSHERPDRRRMITVTHRRYVPYAHAHYAGNLVDGAYALGLFGDVATEVCIRLDGDEGLFAVLLRRAVPAPVQAGDVLEVTATVTRIGTRQPHHRVHAARSCAGATGGSAAAVLDPPIVAVTATGTVVVPPA